MPELPDVTVYVERVAERVVGHTLEKVRLASPFLSCARSIRRSPPSTASASRSLERLGKRIVFVLDDELFLVLHLMVAGRFKWRPARGAKIPGKVGLAAFDFPSGTLLLTEASLEEARVAARGARARGAGRSTIAAASSCSTPTQGRVRRGGAARESHAQARAHRSAPLQRHRQRLLRRDPASRQALAGVAVAEARRRRGRRGCTRRRRTLLAEWTDRLRRESAATFPEKVTAFRPEIAVHGKYRQPCPVCGTPVQRIRYAENETNYCAVCQTGGKLLADRALSRLLHGDWPRSLDEMEERKERGRAH